MIKDMALIAAECVKHPRRKSIWLPDEGRYVCPDSEDARRYYERMAEAQQRQTPPDAVNPSLDPQFKLVFQTAAGGTLLFVTLCVVLTLAAGKEPPPLFEKVVLSIFDLAKIGFGAAVGLIGGKKFQAEEKVARAAG